MKKKKKKMPWYSEDADYIETRICDLEDDPRDLWQDRLLVGMLKVIFHILKWIYKQETKKQAERCKGCMGASFGDCEACKSVDCGWK